MKFVSALKKSVSKGLCLNINTTSRQPGLFYWQRVVKREICFTLHSGSLSSNIYNGYYFEADNKLHWVQRSSIKQNWNKMDTEQI